MSGQCKSGHEKTDCKLSYNESRQVNSQKVKFGQVQSGVSSKLYLDSSVPAPAKLNPTGVECSLNLASFHADKE